MSSERPAPSGRVAPGRRRSLVEKLLEAVYDGLMAIVVLVILPFAAVRWLTKPELRARLGERFAHYPAEMRERLRAGEGCIWVHAVSVGEVRAVLPLVNALAEGTDGDPAPLIVFSTVTVTGNATARDGVPANAIVLYLPVDLRFVVRRAVRILRPRLFVSTESEIWPALLGELQRSGVPSAMANGRVSERTARRYAWVAFFMRRVLSHFQLFCMQSPDFAQRIIGMGAQPERVQVLGNLKYDLDIEPVADARALRAELGLASERPLVVAGSTHEGEEAALLDAMTRLDRQGTSFDLLLAPRHPERFDAVSRLLGERGVAHRRYSAAQEPAPESSAVRVVLLDAMGQLTRLYGVGDVAFVGGTLVPIGGHNLLEPAALGLPVLFGPHTESCREIADGLLEVGGGLRVADAASLASTLGELLSDLARREAVGKAGRAFLDAHRGATQRTVAALAELIA